MPPRPPRPLRPPLTHFLCLPLLTPLSTPQLRTSLQHFTAAVASPTISSPSPTIHPVTSPHPATTDPDLPTPSIPEKAIRPLGTLHLTLGVMSLPSKERIEAAVAFLKSLDVRKMLRKPSTASAAADGITSTVPPAAENTTLAGDGAGGGGGETARGDGFPPLTLSLTGLQAMGSPAATSVLYAAPTDATGRLWGFCNALRKEFVEAGFLVPEERPLLLHATVVNMVYAKERGRKKGKPPVKGDGGAGRGKGKIDARGLREEWEGYVWAEGVRVERVAVCEMGARVVEGREGEGGGYVEVGGVGVA